MSFTSARDKYVANETIDSRDNMCGASNCPNCWSIQSSHLCSWHHWSEPHHWPRITEEQQYAATERVLAKSRPTLVPKPLASAEKVAILNNLRRVLAEQRLAQA